MDETTKDAPPTESPVSAPEAGNEPEAAPTDFARNIWLLIIIFGVVALAWAISVLAGPAGQPPPEQSPTNATAAQDATERPVGRPGRRQPTPRAASQQPRSPASFPPVEMMRSMPDGRDYIHAAPALRLEPTGMVYRRQRLFDITKRDPALDLHLVARLPDFMGRYRYVGAKKPLVIEPGDSGPLKPVGEVGSLLRKDDRLIVLERGATVRAYPIRLVRAYGSVMDTVDDTPVLITWSYYSQVARCVVSRLDEAQVQIVDAGLSYRGCDMLSDAKTGSLWDTAAGKCVAGPMTGRELAMLPVQIVEWQTWRPDHLDDVVLMPDSAERILGIPPAPDADGADRRQRDVLDAYLETDVVPFATAVFRPGEPASDALPPKTYVLGVSTGAAVRAYPLNVVFSLAEHAVRDRMGDLDVSIQATSTRTGHARPGSATGDDISQDVMLWFAWMELNPTTDVYAPPAE